MSTGQENQGTGHQRNFAWSLTNTPETYRRKIIDTNETYYEG